LDQKNFKTRKYTAKVGQDNVNIGVVFNISAGQHQPSSGLCLQKAGVCQPKYCNNAYVHFVLTNLCSIFSSFIIQLAYFVVKETFQMNNKSMAVFSF